MHEVLKIHLENDEILEGSFISLVLFSVNMQLLGELVRYRHHICTVNEQYVCTALAILLWQHEI